MIAEGMASHDARSLRTDASAFGRFSRFWRRTLTGLRQVPDAFARLPLVEVVLHRVDELAHEARAEVDARHHDARDLLVVDLVVDARERDGELVVGVAHVREVDRKSTRL